jgi:hypothetical protein
VFAAFVFVDAFVGALDLAANAEGPAREGGHGGAEENESYDGEAVGPRGRNQGDGFFHWTHLSGTHNTPITAKHAPI